MASSWRSGAENGIGPFDFAASRPITGDPRRDADIYSGIASRNPYPAMAKNYGDLVSGVNWSLGQENQQRSMHNAMRDPNFLFTLTRGGGGPFAPINPLGNPTTTTTSTGASPGNPFSSLNNVKNPNIQSALDSILGGIRNLSSDPTQNTNVVKANIKSPEIASRLAGSLNRFDVDVNDSRQSFADFTKNFLATQPQVKQALDQESGAIGEIYDSGPSGLKGQLDKIARDRAIAVRQAAQRSIGNVVRNNNLSRLTSGDSSYLDQQLLDTVSGVNVDEARQRADLDRSNLLGVKDAQTRMAGVRQKLVDDYVRRMLLPIEARQRMGAGEINQLGSLGQLDAANTFYQMDNPEMLLARKLGLLGDATQLDQANNFYGLQRPYQPDTSGMMGVPRFRGGGGGSDPGMGDYYFPDFSLSQPSIPNPRSAPPRVGMWPGMSGADRSAEMYMQESGFNPSSDPNFSPELWNWAQGNAGTNPRSMPLPAGYYDPGGPGWTPPGYDSRSTFDINPADYEAYA